MRVVVVGASLVGPSVAALLRKEGMTDVTVYEALKRPHSQSGGVMGLRHSTVDVLSRVGVEPSSIRALADESVSAYDMTSPGKAVYRGRSIHPGVTASWDTLYRSLNGNADVHYGQRLTNVEPDGSRWRLTFHTGHTDTADVLIGTDGRKSDVRRILFDNPLRYNGYVVWRGLAIPPRGTLPAGFTRYYDFEAGRLFSVTSPLLQSGRSYWELSHNLPREEWTRVAYGNPEDRAYLLPQQINSDARAIVARAADRLPDEFREMIEHSEVSGIPVNDVRMPDHLVRKDSGGAVAIVLGDAGIPVRLQVGAGLNQGLTQAGELAPAVASVSRVGLSHVDKWERHALDRLAPYVELGRERAHAINLGTYIPVAPGRKAIPPRDDVWGQPEWVTA